MAEQPAPAEPPAAAPVRQSDRPLPAQAAVVIIGGGIMGASIAFHLAEADPELAARGIVLVERETWASGSTVKAAGGVRAQFSDPVNIALGARSLKLWEDFAERPGAAIDLHQPGYLFLLTTDEDVATFEQSVALQNSMGVDSQMLGLDDIRRLTPAMNLQDVLAASFHERDGYCDPESAVLGYVRAARQLGVVARTGVEVVGIDTQAGAVAGVHLQAGYIAAESVVLAAGAWSGQLAATAGLDLPVHGLKRQILITEQLSAQQQSTLGPDLPMTIDASNAFYLHRHGGQLLMGMADPRQVAGFDLQMSDDWLDLLVPAIEHRCPLLMDIGMATGWAGLYEVTPDDNALLGTSDAVNGLWYACGFSGHGFLQGPAVGEVMRDLYLGREPLVDVSAFSAQRFAGGLLRRERNIV